MTDILSDIQFAFDGDEDIQKYCDPKYADASTIDLVYGIYDKIYEYTEKFEHCFFERIMVQGNVAGYFFYIRNPNLLVSFGVNKKYRNKEFLVDVFESIQSKFSDKCFECHMWKRNIRAVNWLKKCGMTEIQSNIPEVVTLKF